jgi:Uncharacterized conserved protein
MGEWTDCPAVERSPGKVSGALLFKGTRVPVRSLFEHLLPVASPFATVERFLEWFPGVSREQVDAVLAFEAMLDGELRLAFPNARFSVACTPEDIARVESELGVSFPAQLRALYLESDGFVQKDSGGLSSLSYLVHETEKLWTLDKVLVGEQLPDFKPFVFFGSPTEGGWFGVRHTQPFDVVSWLPNEPHFKALGANIIDVLKADYANK